MADRGWLEWWREEPRRILMAMTLPLIAIIAFLIMRFAVPRLRSASSTKLTVIALPCAVVGWLLISLVTNLATRR